MYILSALLGIDPEVIVPGGTRDPRNGTAVKDVIVEPGLTRI